jgi:hypothetical protein
MFAAGFVGLGAKMLLDDAVADWVVARAEVAGLDARMFGDAEADREKVAAGEGGTGWLPEGLNRGASSLVISGNGLTFFSRLDFEGLSTMLLKMFEVFDPVEPPFIFNLLLSLSPCSKSSFVNSFSAFLLPFGEGDIGGGAVGVND